MEERILTAKVNELQEYLFQQSRDIADLRWLNDHFEEQAAQHWQRLQAARHEIEQLREMIRNPPERKESVN